MSADDRKLDRCGSQYSGETPILFGFELMFKVSLPIDDAANCRLAGPRGGTLS